MAAIRLRGRGKWPSFLLSDWSCRSALRLWVLLLLWQSFENQLKSTLARERADRIRPVRAGGGHSCINLGRD